MGNSLLGNEQNETKWADFVSKAEPLKTTQKRKFISEIA